MIKCLLILVLILMSFPSATTGEFKKLSKTANLKRSVQCGIPKHQNKKYVTRADDAPWHAKIFKETDVQMTSGVLISPIHILTDYAILQNYEIANNTSTPCKGGIVNTDPLGLSGRDKITVQFEICYHVQDCSAVSLVTRKIVREQAFGECKESNILMLIEIDPPIEAIPICLPSRILENGDEVIAEVFYKNRFALVTTKVQVEEGESIWTKDDVYDSNSQQAAIPLIGYSEERAEIVAIGKHGYGTETDGTGPFLAITHKYVDLICQVTGVCQEPLIDPPTTAPNPAHSPKLPVTLGPSQSSQIPPEGTRKSRIIEDWPPPIPTIRPPIRVTPVDFLPQNKEDYDDEEQLLLEYEQIEREEREREEKMEEKKGTEGWNVLVGVGITVLIGLI